MRRPSALLITPLFLCTVAAAQLNPIAKLETLTREAYDLYLTDPDKTISLSREALPRALESGDTYHEGYCYFLLSKAYWVKANYQLSTEYGFKALRIFQQLQRDHELSACLLSLARTLAELGNFDKAHEFIHMARDIARTNNDETMRADVFREHSFLLAELNQLDSALLYADRALSIFEPNGDSLDVSILYGRKSRIYYQKMEFAKSRDYAYRALHIDTLVNNRRAEGIAYYQIAQNEYAVGNREKAIAQLQKSIRINSEIGNLNFQIRAHELLASFYLDLGKSSLAAEQLLLVNKFKDELYDAEKNGQIQEMRALHDLEAKERTIQFLGQENALKQQQVKNQRLFLAFLLAALVSLILLLFFLTRLRRIQKKTNLDLTSRNHAIERQKLAIQKQAEHLQHLDDVKTKLFSVISHDLRGPISNLQAILDLFTRKLMTTEEFLSLSAKLKENLNVTQRTLENLLTWSLSQMGGIRTERRRIDVTASIGEACDLLEEAAQRKNIQLKKPEAASLFVWADANQLQVVLRNLIHNAIKFSRANDAVEIAAEVRDNFCIVSVKDSGVGMTQAEINGILSSKEYISRAGTVQEKGTGLGLLLCQEFVASNDGEMKIKSRPGKGTEVSFTLLLAEEPEPAHF